MLFQRRKNALQTPSFSPFIQIQYVFYTGNVTTILALLLGTASSTSSLVAFQAPNSFIYNNDNDQGWTIDHPASMQPPLPPTLSNTTSPQSDLLHYGIPVYGIRGGPGAVPLSIDLTPNPLNVTVTNPSLLSLLLVDRSELLSLGIAFSQRFYSSQPVPDGQLYE